MISKARSRSRAGMLTSAVVLVLASAQCGGKSALLDDPVRGDTNGAVDPGKFAAVVEMIAASGAGNRYVDPRPLRLAPVANPDSVLATDPGPVVRDEIVEALVPSSIVFPDSADLAAVPEAVVAKRQAILTEYDLREVDFFRDQAKCPGILVPPMQGVDRSQCPERSRVLIILTVARPGGAYWPGGVDERDEGLVRGHWSILATVRAETQQGVWTNVEEFVVAPKEAGAWQVVKRIVHLTVE